MKALSLTQPWATLIAIGAKRVETRSWSTNYRGVVAIHASKGFPKWAHEYITANHFWDRLQPTEHTEPKDFPCGAIIAIATLTTVGTTTAAVNAGLSPEQIAFGDFSAGRFAWFFNNIIKLIEPIPCKGALGLWEVPQGIAEQMKLVA
jgi:hypothetical protein